MESTTNGRGAPRLSTAKVAVLCRDEFAALSGAGLILETISGGEHHIGHSRDLVMQLVGVVPAHVTKQFDRRSKQVERHNSTEGDKRGFLSYGFEYSFRGRLKFVVVKPSRRERE